MAAGTNEPSVACHESTVEGLGQGDVRCVVGGEVVAELEGATAQRVGRGPTLDRQIVEIGQRVLGPRRA